MGDAFTRVDFELEADGSLAAILRRHPEAELRCDLALLESCGTGPRLQELSQPIQNRTDLLVGHSHAFLAADHVAAEITGSHPDQQQRFAAELAAGTISEARVTSTEEIQPCRSMFAIGQTSKLPLSNVL